MNTAEVLSDLTEKFDEFKSRYDASLAAERKEREALELRLQRFGLKGSSSLTPVRSEGEIKAVSAFIRGGGSDDWSKDAEIKGMSIGSDPDGGYLVLPYLSQSMTTRLRDMSPLRRLARGETLTSGDAFEEPDDRDEVGATWVAESQSRGDTGSPQLGKWRIELHEIYAQPKATQRLLDDSDRDLGAWLEGKINDKFGRSEGTAFVTGNGVGRPRGFLDYPTTTEVDFTRAAGKLQYIASGNSSGFASTNPGDVLKSLVWKLRAPYRAGAVWLMNSNTASTVDNFKNAQGDYLWRDSLGAGLPPTLLGYPVEIDENMPDIGAGAFPIAFGNFKLGYCIVDRPGIKLLRDPFSDKPNVKFYAYKRVGGGVTDDNAIKLLKIATS